MTARQAVLRWVAREAQNSPACRLWSGAARNPHEAQSLYSITKTSRVDFRISRLRHFPVPATELRWIQAKRERSLLPCFCSLAGSLGMLGEVTLASGSPLGTTRCENGAKRNCGVRWSVLNE